MSCYLWFIAIICTIGFIWFIDEDDNGGKDVPYEKIDGLDLGLTDLTKELREIFKIPSHENGVLVSFVGSSLIDDLSINVGNLIKKVNRFEIKNLNDLKTALVASLRENDKVNKVVIYVKDPLVKKTSYVVVKCDRNRILKGDKVMKKSIMLKSSGVLKKNVIGGGNSSLKREAVR